MEIKLLNKKQIKLFNLLSLLLGLIMFAFTLLFYFINIEKSAVIQTVLYVITAIALGVIPGIVLKNFKIALICGSIYGITTLGIWMYLKSSGGNNIVNLGPNIISIIPPILLGLFWGLLISNYKKNVALMSILGGILGFYVAFLPVYFFSSTLLIPMDVLYQFKLNPTVINYLNFGIINMSVIFQPIITLHFILLFSSISLNHQTKTFFKDLLSFKGFVNQYTYMKWWILYFIFQLSIFGLAQIINEVSELGDSFTYNHLNLIYSSAIYVILNFLFSLVLLSLSVKRLNDTNSSLWYILLGIIPVVNLYVLYLLLIKKRVVSIKKD